MSTRATYRFSSTALHSGATLYIHHDGYLAGAASYFYAAFIRGAGSGGLVERMIRANTGAQLAASRDKHSDTEFHYEVTGDGLDARVEALGRGYQENWATKFDGSIAKLINRYREDFRGWHDDFADIDEIRTVQLPYQKIWLNTRLARLYLDREYGELEHLRVWQKNDALPTWSANWQNQVEGLEPIVKAFPHLNTDEIAAFTATLGDRMPAEACAN